MPDAKYEQIEEEIRSAVLADIETFYGLQLMKTEKDGQNLVFKCCFCDDVRGHFYVYRDSGRHHCFKCNTDGSFYDFWIKRYNTDFSIARRQIADKYNIHLQEFIKPPIPMEVVELFHKNLLDHPEFKELVQKKYGLNDDTILKYKLGYEKATSRLTIPIIDPATGACMNIKHHLPYDWETQSKSYHHKMVYADGNVISYGSPPRLYRHEVEWERVENSDILIPQYFDIVKRYQTIIVTEGELKGLLLLQNGYHAISPTGGAGQWDKSWTELLQRKIVYIVYDVKDKAAKVDNQDRVVIEGAGERNAKRVARLLNDVGCEVYIIWLPAWSKDKKFDITNYFVDENHSKEDFDTLIADAIRYAPPIEPGATSTAGKPVRVSFTNINKSCYFGKHIEFEAIIIGNQKQHFAPKEVRLDCAYARIYKEAEKSICKSCGQWLKGIYNTKQVIEAADRDLLKLVDVSDTWQRSAFQQIYNTASCRTDSYKPVNAYNIQELLISAPLDFGLDPQDLMPKEIFYVYEAEENKLLIEPSKQYRFTGIVTSEPKKQRAIVQTYIAKPVNNSIQGFTMTDNIKESLKVFQPKRDQSIQTKLNEIYADFEYNIIKRVWGRRELLLALDLCYNSVLNFYFQGALIDQGWTNIAAVSDTGCGKSTTTQAMMTHYQLGDLAIGEQASAPGLFGSAQKHGEEWFMKYGLMARADGALIIVDEWTGLDVESIAMMSDARSRGLIKLSKAAEGKALCRVRLFISSNTREGIRLKSFAFGVYAIKTLMGKDEDIRRIDLAIPMSSDDISPEIIHRRYEDIDKVGHIYTSQLCSWRTLWAWSRRADQVIITKDATTAILDYSMELLHRYSEQIPLVHPSDIRIKLCRLSIALAATLYSCSDNGESIVVDKSHVDTVVAFMKEMYDRDCFDYRRYSALVFQERLVLKEDKEYAKYIFESVFKESFLRKAFADMVLNTQNFRSSMVMQSLGLEKKHVSEMLQHLRMGKAYLKDARSLPLLKYDAEKSTFNPTPGFLELLKHYIFEEPEGGDSEFPFGDNVDNEDLDEDKEKI